MIPLSEEGRDRLQSRKQFIWDIVYSSHGHLSAEQIIGLAREKEPRIAVGTVYRNLSALLAEGKLRGIAIPGSPLLYDATLAPHEHLVCRRCGRLKDAVLSADLLSLLREATGEEVRDYDLSMGYICEECRKKE